MRNKPRILALAASSGYEPRHDAGADVFASDADAAADGQVDAKAGPLLHCWCDGEEGRGTKPGQGDKCAPGQICGYFQIHGNGSFCCDPVDDGIPNCQNNPPEPIGPDSGYGPYHCATPNCLLCKMPHDE